MERENLVKEFFDKYFKGQENSSEFFDEYKERLIKIVTKEVNSIRNINNDKLAVVMAINSVGSVFHKIIKFNFQPLDLESFEEVMKGK